MKSNPFAVLSEDYKPPEGSNSESLISPILKTESSNAAQSTAATQSPILFTMPQNPQVPPAQARGNQEKPKRIIFDNVYEEAQYYTQERLQRLMSSVKRLSEYLSKDIVYNFKTLTYIEMQIIHITEALIQLRKDFKAKHYDKIVHEYEKNGVTISWPKIIRNQVVHKSLFMKNEEAFTLYLSIARTLISLSDYESRRRPRPMNLDQFIDFGQDFSKHDSHLLEYTDSVEILLNDLFDKIADYDRYSLIIIVMSMAKVGEIIRQLIAKDPMIVENGIVKIHAKPLNPDIIPSLLAVRKVVYHALPELPQSDIEKVVEVALTLKEEPRKYQIG